MAIALIIARFLFIPVWIVIYPAWKGWHHETIWWLVIWIPAMALIAGWIDIAFASMANPERQSFGDKLAGTALLAVFKLVVFIPLGAASFFGAAAISG